MTTENGGKSRLLTTTQEPPGSRRAGEEVTRVALYSAIICVALLWLLVWLLWPGPRRDNCSRCAWCYGEVCTYPTAQRTPELLREIQAGKWICPWREVRR